VAARIAQLAERNFLVAGLIARAHGLYDEVAVDPESLAFPPEVEDALAAYLARVGGVGGVPAGDLLAALAHAEDPGLPLSLWALAVRALTGRGIGEGRLGGFAAASAAAFLVETSAAGGQPVFRLFHQALADALLAARARARRAEADGAALVRAFLAHGRRVGWRDAPAYLLRSLPGHAVQAGAVDELLAEDEFLLAADLRRLIPAAEHAAGPGARRRARLLRLTPRALTASPPERAALFSVTETLEGLGTAFRARPAPYHGVWANTRPRVERGVLEGHTGWVLAVCPVQAGGRSLLASAGDDGTVRLWDPATGEPGAVLHGHTGRVTAACPVQAGGRSLLASAGTDGTVRLWDPATGEAGPVLHGHTGWVTAVCPVQAGGRSLLASGGTDGTVRLWDPATGEPGVILRGHLGDGVRAVCPVQAGGRSLLASAGVHGTVRLWDPATGEPGVILRGHTGVVSAVCPVQAGGRSLLASGGHDRIVRLWDPTTGFSRDTIPVHHEAAALSFLPNQLLAVGLSVGILTISFT
jgi:hypothetical protein